MGWISLKRTPNFLAVNVQNPDAQKYMRLTIRNSESEPLIFNLFAFIAQYDQLKLAALKADGSYYQVSVSGKRFLPNKKMKSVAERTYLDNKPAFLIYKQDTHQRKLSREQSTIGIGAGQSALPQSRARQPALKTSGPLVSLASNDSSTTIAMATRNAANATTKQSLSFHSVSQLAANAKTIPAKTVMQGVVQSDPTPLREKITKEILEQFIKISSSGQENCAVINRYDEDKKREQLMRFDLRHLRLTQTEGYSKPGISVPSFGVLKQILSHSFAHLSFPEWEKSCLLHSNFIFIDMLQCSAREDFGCSHVLTVKDLCPKEITATYSGRKRLYEKYQIHMIQKGKGIFKALCHYNFAFKGGESKCQAVQIPADRSHFNARDYGYYDGTQPEFEMITHALLIFGMLSAMVDPGCKVKDQDIPYDLVVKLPVGVTEEQRHAIIKNILAR
jgi:hypothetical protein